MNERLDRALAAASGIKLTITPLEAIATANSAETFSINFSNGGTIEADVLGITSRPRGVRIRIIQGTLRLLPRMSSNVTEYFRVPDNAPVSVPHSEHLYDGLWRGLEFSKSYEVVIENDIRFHITTSARVDVARPVEIASVKPWPVVLTPATLNKPLTLSYHVINHMRTPFAGFVGSGNRVDRDGATETFALPDPRGFPR